MWVREHPLPSRGIVPVRLAAGWVLFSAALPLALAGAPDLAPRADLASPLLAGFVDAEGALPRSQVASLILVAAALVSGACLFLGALTRPAALLGLSISALCAVAALEPSVRQGAVLLGACCLGCALTPAGLRLGLDAFLVGRAPWWITWTLAPGLRLSGTRARP